MQNLLFSLNATIPVFLMMVAGYFFRNKTSLVDEPFASKANKFVFKVALPVQLFHNLASEDFSSVWNGKIIIFCFFSSLICILIMFGLSFLLKDKSGQAEFIQAGYRGSQALLGSVLMSNIYGTTGPLSLVLIGAVPLYNVCAVIVLTCMRPGGKLDKATVLKTIKGIVTNPIILSIFAGLIWSFLHIPYPTLLSKTLSPMAAIASPLGLLALGASTDLKKVAKCWRPTVVCTAFKLVIFAGMFVPVAVAIGCRNEMLVAMLVMLASPTTASAFTMAKSMGHDGSITSGSVGLTTLLSAFTFTAWLFILRSIGLI